jgi:hypothetical protein
MGGVMGTNVMLLARYHPYNSSFNSPITSLLLPNNFPYNFLFLLPFNNLKSGESLTDG